MFSCQFLIRLPELYDYLESYLALTSRALCSQKAHSYLVVSTVMLECDNRW